jgi:phage gp36-like protein
MSDYVTLSAIKGALPDEITAQLLDDDSSGAPDSTSWAAVVAAVRNEVDGKIGQRFALPLPDPVPPSVLNAAFVLAAELIYQRRGFFGDSNPYAKRAADVRTWLDAIATGAQPLTPDIQRKKPSASAITECARTFSPSGRLSM